MSTRARADADGMNDDLLPAYLPYESIYVQRVDARERDTIPLAHLTLPYSTALRRL